MTSDDCISPIPTLLYFLFREKRSRYHFNTLIIPQRLKGQRTNCVFCKDVWCFNKPELKVTFPMSTFCVTSQTLTF